MAGTDRLITLLGQYRDRLHTQGDVEHDEDLSYLMEVLESPLMSEYLSNNTSEVGVALIQEMTSTFENQENDVHLSPRSQRKRYLARTASLRALKLAVTPRSSPSSTPNIQRSVNTQNVLTVNSTSSVDSPLLQSVEAALRSKEHSESTSFSSPPRETNYQRQINGDHFQNNEHFAMMQKTNSHTSQSLSPKHQNVGPHNLPDKKRPSSEQISTQPFNQYPSIDHIYISPYTGKVELPSRNTSTSPSDIGDQRNSLLSESPIERTSTPYSRDVGLSHKNSNGTDYHGYRKETMSEDIRTHNISSKEGSPVDLSVLPTSPTDQTRPPLPSYNEALNSQQNVQPQNRIHDDTEISSIKNTPPISFSPPVSKGQFPPYYPGGPVTAGLPTQNLPTGQSRGQSFIIRLHKGNQGLGFSINKRKNSKKRELSIFVQDLQPGGVAEKDGRLKKGDHLVSINGQKLAGIGLPTAVALLQQAKGSVEIIVLRGEGVGSEESMVKSPSPNAIPPIQSPTSRSHELSPVPLTKNPSVSPQMKELSPPRPIISPDQFSKPRPSPPPISSSPLMSPLPSPSQSRLSQTHQRQKLAMIELPNEGQGFGFSVITANNSGVTQVHLIQAGSTAEKDGRLTQGDQLVAINDETILGVPHSAIVDRLQDISRKGHPLKLVIARVPSPLSDEKEEDSASDIDSSSDNEDHEVELVKPVGGGGLGITINALVNDEKGEDKGIYIRSVNPTGPAGLSGNVFVKDHITSVNGQSLKNMSNMAAANILRNGGNKVSLLLRRKKGRIVRQKNPVSNRDDQRKDLDGGVIHTEEGIEVLRKSDKTGQEEGDVGNGCHGDVDDYIRNKWVGLIPLNKTLKAASITRTDSSVGLGFKMESIVVCDDTGQPQRGSIRHVIKSIRNGGPSDNNQVLRVGDELLEVNGELLLGVTHEEAIRLVQSAPKDVKIIVCRLRETENDQEEEVSDNPTTDVVTPDVPVESSQHTTTSESEDDHGSTSATTSLTSSSSPALQSLYPDFARRFERQSYRQRHEEEKRRWKERFELRREHYQRQVLEKEEELKRAEKELEERNKRLQVAEEKHKQEAEAKRSSLQYELDYSYYPSPIGFFPLNETSFTDESPVTSPNHRDSMASEDSYSSIISPVPGLGLWESDVIEIDLPKGKEGLGFSILDFADPVNPGDRVILVYSLVPGGMAERDGRLLKGDKLLSVNGVSVVNHSLDFTVEQLTNSQDGLVYLSVSHPLPVSPDINSTPSSFSPDDISQLLLQDVISEGDMLSGSDKEKEDDEEKDLDKKRTLTPGASLGLEDEGDEQKVTKTTKDANDPLKNDWKGKRPPNEDEEPPPPYTEIDPLQKRTELSPSHDRNGDHRQRGDDNSVRSMTPGMSSSNSQHQPNFSRTRSDEPALQYNGILLNQISETHSHLMESTSEETLVGSSSHQDLHFSSNQPSPKQQSSPQLKTHGLVTSYSQGNTFSPSRSQESFLEGLSPDTSDTGDHSAELESEPRDIEIRKGTSPLGMTLMEDKGFIVVKKIDGSSVLGKDGRIRIGDRILAINGKSLDGLSMAKVKSILKRASSTKSTKVKITYQPAPHGFSMSYNNDQNIDNTQQEITNSSTALSHYTQSHPLTHHPVPMRQIQTQTSLPIITTPMGHPIPSMIPSQQHSYTWLPGQHLSYTPPGPLPPRSHVTLQETFIEHPTPIKPPPPPYGMYPGGPMNPTTIISSTQPYPQQLTHWNLQGPEYPQGSGNPWSMGIQNHPQYQEYHPGNQYQPQARKYQQPHMMRPAGSGGIEDHNTVHHVGPPTMTYQMDTYTYSQYLPHGYEGLSGDSREGYDLKIPLNKRETPDTELWVKERGFSDGGYSKRGNNGVFLEPVGALNFIEIKRDSTGSLGISLGTPEDGIEGVVVIDLSPACSASSKGRLSPGDRILEVNGRNLRHATQAEAVNIIKFAGNPVCILVQSYSSSAFRRRGQSSPLHSNDGSWAIDEEEDDQLRNIFPNANGHLFQVVLNKGKLGLGLSIWKTDHSPSRGVVIMQVQPGGLADQIAKIKVGDEILQVNNSLVLGWSHQEVSQLLAQSPPHVKMVLVRPLPVPPSSTQLAPPPLPPTTTQSQTSRQQQVLHQQEQQGNNTRQPDAGEGNKKRNSGTQVDMSGLPLVKAVTLERDDEKGLGFTVSEGENREEMRVIVTSIVPDGPADKDGQLQVGDHIISVDGHKVLGVKYEKATHLLQQARSRGHVSLIVSTKGQLPPHLVDKIESAPRKRRNMGEKRMRVRSEGVTLGNKITKTPVLKSRRRPVSVDCEMQYDLSEINNNKEEDSGNHSNRNSLALSETQDSHFLKPESSKKLGSPDIEIVELIKPEQGGLGLMILEDETNGGGVLVNEVIFDEVAAKCGRIRKGDKILAINGEDISSSEQATVISLLQACRGKVSLVVQHLGEEVLIKSPSVNESSISTPPSRYGSHSPEYSSPGGVPRPHNPPPYSNQTEQSKVREHRGSTPLRSDPSIEEGEGYSPLRRPLVTPPQYRDVVGQSIPDNPHMSSNRGHPPPPSLIRGGDIRNIKVVHLQRGPSGLGFSIVGGKGSVNGDLPICIRSVSKDSIPGREGKLKPGDVIVAVNGISFENLTHQAAVETLKRLHDNIMITICST